MSSRDPLPDAAVETCRCQIVGSTRDPYEPHIPAQPEWEQADDCPVHPLAANGYPPGDPGPLSVRCDPEHLHDARCDQDEIGDWWHVISRLGQQP